MSNYLLRLAARSLGILDIIYPRTISLFETPQNDSMILNSLMSNSLVPEGETSEARIAGSSYANDLIADGRIDDSLISGSRAKEQSLGEYLLPEEASCETAPDDIHSSLKIRGSAFFFPGIFPPNPSGRHCQDPAAGDIEGSFQGARDGRFGKEGSGTLSKAGSEINPDGWQPSMRMNVALPPERADLPPDRDDHSLDANQSGDQISIPGNPGRTEGSLSAPANQRFSSGVIASDSSIFLKHPLEYSVIQKIPNLQENPGEQIEATLSDSLRQSGLVDLNISDQKHLLPAGKNKLAIKASYAVESSSHNKHPVVRMRRALLRRSSPLQTDWHFSEEPLDFNQQSKAVSHKALKASGEISYLRGSLLQKGAFQLQSAAEKESEISGHVSDDAIMTPAHSSVTGNAPQFDSAQISSELYPEEKEVESWDEQKDDRSNPGDLPASSIHSKSLLSDLYRNFRQAKSISGVLRANSISEHTGSNPRAEAPSVKGSRAFVGAPASKHDLSGPKESEEIPAVSDPQRADRELHSISSTNPARLLRPLLRPVGPDIFEGVSLSDLSISKMRAASGGSRMEEVSQVQANQISAPQVSRSQVLAQQIASIQHDELISASSQAPDSRDTPAGVLPLNVSLHDAPRLHASPIMKKPPHNRASLLSSGTRHLPIETNNEGLHEDISHFPQGEAGGRSALSERRSPPLQDSTAANSALENNALPIDRSLSDSACLAEPGRTMKIGTLPASSSEPKRAAVAKVNRDGSEKELFAIRPDSDGEGRIKVIIGRIDVRADLPHASREKHQGALPATPSDPHLTLDSYLKQRNEGKL